MGGRGKLMVNECLGSLVFGPPLGVGKGASRTDLEGRKTVKFALCTL